MSPSALRLRKVVSAAVNACDRMAMMKIIKAIATSSSTSVNPCRRFMIDAPRESGERGRVSAPRKSPRGNLSGRLRDPARRVMNLRLPTGPFIEHFCHVIHDCYLSNVGHQVRLQFHCRCTARLREVRHAVEKPGRGRTRVEYPAPTPDGSSPGIHHDTVATCCASRPKT